MTNFGLKPCEIWDTIHQHMTNNSIFWWVEDLPGSFHGSKLHKPMGELWDDPACSSVGIFSTKKWAFSSANRWGEPSERMGVEPARTERPKIEQYWFLRWYREAQNRIDVGFFVEIGMGSSCWSESTPVWANPGGRNKPSVSHSCGHSWPFPSLGLSENLGNPKSWVTPFSKSTWLILGTLLDQPTLIGLFVISSSWPSSWLHPLTADRSTPWELRKSGPNMNFQGASPCSCVSRQGAFFPSSWQVFRYHPCLGSGSTLDNYSLRAVETTVQMMWWRPFAIVLRVQSSI